MSNDTFKGLVDRRFEKCRETLIKKASEYSPDDDDRLHNFNLGAAYLGCAAEWYALNLLTKHLVSIRDMVASGYWDEETIDEKIGDAINYLLLLEAIMKEDLV